MLSCTDSLSCMSKFSLFSRIPILMLAPTHWSLKKTVLFNKYQSKNYNQRLGSQSCIPCAPNLHRNSSPSILISCVLPETQGKSQCTFPKMVLHNFCTMRFHAPENALRGGTISSYRHLHPHICIRAAHFGCECLRVWNSMPFTRCPAPNV